MIDFDVHSFNNVDGLGVGSPLAYKMELDDGNILYFMKREGTDILMVQLNNGPAYSTVKFEWSTYRDSGTGDISIKLGGGEVHIQVIADENPYVGGELDGKDFDGEAIVSRVRRSINARLDETWPGSWCHHGSDSEYIYSMNDNGIVVEIPQHYKRWQHIDEPLS